MGWFVETFLSQKAIRYSEDLCEILGQGLITTEEPSGIGVPRDAQTFLWDQERMKYKRVKVKVQTPGDMPADEWRLLLPGDELGMFLFPAHIQVSKEPIEKAMVIQAPEEECRQFKVESGMGEGNFSSTVKRFLPDSMIVQDEKRSKHHITSSCDFSIVEPFLRLRFTQKIAASDIGLSYLIPGSGEAASIPAVKGARKLRDRDNTGGPKPPGELSTHVVSSLVLGLRLEGELTYGKPDGLVGIQRLQSATVAFEAAAAAPAAAPEGARSSTRGVSPERTRSGRGSSLERGSTTPVPPSTPRPESRSKSRGSVSRRSSTGVDRPKSRQSTKSNTRSSLGTESAPVRSRVETLEYSWAPNECPEGPFTGKNLDDLFTDVEERWRTIHRGNPWRWPVLYIEADSANAVRKETYDMSMLGKVDPGHHDSEGRCSVCNQTMRFIKMDTKTLVLDRNSIFLQCHSCYDQPPVQSFYCTKCDEASPLCQACGDDPRHQNPIEFSTMTEHIVMVSCEVPFARQRLPDLKALLGGKSGFHSPREAERLLSPFLTQLTDVLDVHPEQVHVVAIMGRLAEDGKARQGTLLDDNATFEITFCKSELACLLKTSTSSRGALASVSAEEEQVRRRQVCPLQLFLEFREIFKNGELRDDLQQNADLECGLHAVDFRPGKGGGPQLKEMVVTNKFMLTELLDTLGAEDAETLEKTLLDALTMVFNTFDADKDSMMKPSEFVSLQSMLSDTGGYGDLGSEFVLAIFTMVDRNQNGLIDLHEFIDAQNEIMAQYVRECPRKDWPKLIFQVEKEMRQIRKEEAKAAKASSKGEQVVMHYARVKPVDLNTAIIQGDQEKVNTFCQRGADVNALCPKGDGPLHLAAFHGLPEITNILIKYKGKMDLRNSEGKVPLDAAHDQSQMAVMQILLDSGAKLGTCTKTALFDAVKNNDRTGVPLLVRGGADREAKDMKRRSPVDLAWEEMRFSVCEALVLEGVQFDKHASSALLEYMTGIHSVGPYQKKSGDPFVGDDFPDESQMAQMIVTGGCDLKAMDDSGNTAYHLAATHRGTEAAIVLAQAATEDVINLRNELFCTCLDAAAEAENWTVAQAFVNVGAELDEAKAHVLFKPVRDNNVLAVDICVRGKAIVDAHNDRQDTPLHMACERGYTEVAKMLLNAPIVPNLNVVNTFKATPLHACAAKGYAEIAKAMVDTENADINAENYKGFTALDVALEFNHTDVADILVTAGAKTKCMGPEKLFDALQRDDDKAVAAIIHARVDLDARDGEGRSCLHLCVEKNNSASMRLLIGAHAFVNAQNLFQQDTPLMLTARLGFVDMAKILFEKTNERENHPETSVVRVDLLNLNKQTALDVAFDSGDHVEVAEMIVDNGGKLAKRAEDSLLYTARAGTWDWIPVLLAGGANVFAIEEANEARPTACHILAEKGGVESIRQLAAYKADVNTVDRWQRSALHLAAAAGCVVALFEAQAELNKTDRNLQTPLHVACHEGRDQVVDAILMVTADYKKRANPSAEDIDRNTPSHLAAKAGHAEVLKVLLRRRSLASESKNSDGALPRDLAKKGGHKAAAEVLEKGK